MRCSLLITLTATLALASCGDSPATADAGYKSLQSGDYAAALATFDTVLAGVPKEDAGYKTAVLDRLQALAHVNAEQSKTEFLALLDGGMALGAKDFSLIATELNAAGEAGLSVAIIDMGKKTFPEDATIAKLLEKAIAMAKADPDGAGAAALSGLGYL
ncbi:MAG: hypothetical protein ACI9HE_002083 [Planctomycetota bacterium]|jgi:hypothetical protein